MAYMWRNVRAMPSDMTKRKVQNGNVDQTKVMCDKVQQHEATLCKIT